MVSNHVVKVLALDVPDAALGGRPTGWRLLVSRGAGEAGTSCSPTLVASNNPPCCRSRAHPRRRRLLALITEMVPDDCT
jgi:hypothetical protein